MKYFGKIGFIEEQVETAPGVFEDKIVEREYYGDVIRNTSRWQSDSRNLNDNLNMSNQFKILFDPYAFEHLQNLRYLEYNNVKWKIITFELDYPRVTIYIGGVYNGDEGPSV